MTIEMRLEPDIFDAIASGRKQIENRLYDAKRQTLLLGDEIILKKRPECIVQCRVKIIGLLRYATFDQMLDDIPMALFDLNEDDRPAEKELLRRFYTPEDEMRYGVIGIRIKLI